MELVQLGVEQLFIRCSVGGAMFIEGGVYIPPNSPNDLYTVSL